MRMLLRDAFTQDPEKSFLGQICRNASDPAMPRNTNDRFRIHPLWLILGLITAFVIGVFFYFSFAK